MTETAPSSRKLAGRRALLTGAAGGIARATAVRFAQEGAAILLTDLDAAGLEDSLNAVREAGGTAHGFVADVLDAASVKALVTEAESRMGSVDILVTCAGGYSRYSTFDEITEAEWDRVIALNLKSVFLCCKAVLPAMRRGGWGRIINLGSLAGRSTSAGTSPAHYGAAKAAVSMLSQYIAKDVAGHGITVNTLAPGTTRTDRVSAMLTPEKLDSFLRMTPIGRLAEPEDVASIILFLASEDSGYITGATIDANGGRLMVI